MTTRVRKRIYAAAMALAVASALLLTASAPAHAQAGTAAVEGLVTDDTGAALPGVPVVVTHEESGIARPAVTGPDGRFRATALRPGPYTIAFDLTGFTTTARTWATPSVGSTSTVNVTMKVGGRSESGTVTAEAPLIDTASAEVGVTVTTP